MKTSRLVMIVEFGVGWFVRHPSPLMADPSVKATMR